MEDAVSYTPDHAQLKRYFEDARDTNDHYRKESLIDRDFFDGYQWSAEEREVLAQRQQPPLYFNEVKLSIRGLIGVWEAGEIDPRAWPRNPQDEDSADVATKTLRYVKDYAEWDDKRTACALNYFVEGTCAAIVEVDENRRVQIEPIAFEEFFHDPRSRKLDFSDARYMGIAKWVFAEDLAAQYPDKAEEISSAIEGGTGTLGAAGDTFADRPDEANIAWTDRKLRRVFVVEMYHRERGTWMRCKFWGLGILEAGPSPFLKEGRPTCPIEARSCYIDRENRRYGEARDLRSPQEAINKRESKLLAMLNTRQLQAENELALQTDAELARQEAARPDGVLPVGWKPVPLSDLATGQFALLENARAFMQRIGQNPAVLAQQSASASGRAQEARQQAGMIDSAMTLNGLRKFELGVYRQVWDRCRQFWTQPDWIRVTDDEGAPEFIGINQPVQGVQTAIDPATGEMIGIPVVLGYQNALAELQVDITIDAVPNVATLAQEQFQEMVGLAQGGVPIPPKLLIQASSLPNKRELLETLEAESQQPNPQAEMAMAAGQAEIEKTQSETMRNVADAQAKVAGIELQAFQAGQQAGMGAADPEGRNAAAA